MLQMRCNERVPSTTLLSYSRQIRRSNFSGDAVGSRNHLLEGASIVWEGGVRATSSSLVRGFKGNDYFPYAWCRLVAHARRVCRLRFKGTLPLDGVSHHDTIIGKGQPPRNGITIGNSMNLCSWKVGDGA